MLSVRILLLILALGLARADDDHYLYDQVSYNEKGQIWAKQYRMVGEHPLLPYLAPGMWVEAKGHWGKQHFVVEKLKTVQPEIWVYYHDQSTAQRTWFANKRVFYHQNTASIKDTVLVGWVQKGRFVALPEALQNTLHLPRIQVSGWVYLSGKKKKQSMAWSKPRLLDDHDD